MQSVSSKIWTRVAVSISNDDNHYTTGTSSADDYDSTIECAGYDTKQSDGEVSVMLLGMWGTSSLLLLPGPLCPEVVATDRVK